MALESTTYINGLVATNPTGTDPKSQGDDHIRLVKSAIKNTFTGITGEVTATHTELNYCDGVTSNIQTQLNTAFQSAYPVGSIYMNASNSTNPGSLLGFGTWVAFGEGRMLLGESASYTAGATGGSKDAVVVSHNHPFTGTTSTAGTHQHNTSWGENTGGDYGTSGSANQFGSSGTDHDNYEYKTSFAGNHSHTVAGNTSTVGSSGTNANMPPYIVVYMWKRTA